VIENDGSTPSEEKGGVAKILDQMGQFDNRMKESRGRVGVVRE